MIESLQANTGIKGDDELASRVLIIQRALVLLLDTHRAVKEDALAASELTKDLSKRKTVDGLLDLISLEGIYPSLSPGVGIPIERRVKSVLRNGIVTRPSTSGYGPQIQSQSLLAEICQALDEILKDGVGLAFLAQQRILVDLIAGFGELGHSDSIESMSSRNTFSCRLRELLDRYVFLQSKMLRPVMLKSLS